LLHLAAAGAVMVAAAGWWILAVEVVPADDRPYVGGTTSDSFLEYVLGYNGLDRVTSSDGPGGGNDAFGGGSGWDRLFNDQVGGQVSWFIPLAASGLTLGWWSARRCGRSNPVRAGWLLWGTAFAAHFLLFSMMNGVFHPYYTLTMAPAIGALAGAGIVTMWRAYRSPSAAGWLLPAAISGTAAWAGVLLARTSDFASGLGTAVVAVGLAAGGALALLRPASRSRPRVAVAAAAAGLVVLLAGPAVYAVDTLGSSVGGGDPKAGPDVAEQPAPMAAGPVGTGDAGPVDRLPDAAAYDRPPLGGRADIGRYPLGPADAAPPTEGIDDRTRYPGLPPDGGPGGAAALQGALVDYLVANHDDETWLVAVETAHISAPLILETGEAVMTMGGFSGGDPAPDETELAGLVAAGELRYVLLTQGRNIGLGGPAPSPWERWVPEHCALVDPAEYGPATVGGAALYDCSAA
jgi:4-amino-4-deoxy-L-arabinose transferase-like glycosyltransferase